MSAVASLERTQQHLIDVRLDSLDRILMDSGVSRSERSEIVQAVEDQIFEMLDQQGENVTRESIIQLLRQLDPPEAYCNEEFRPEIAERSPRSIQRQAIAEQQAAFNQAVPVTPAKTSGVAIASFVMAMLSIPLIIVWPLGSIFALAAGICGIIALASIGASQGKLRGSWMAIIGCVMVGIYVLGVGLVFMLAM